jgi:hypothetical protein
MVFVNVTVHIGTERQRTRGASLEVRPAQPYQQRNKWWSAQDGNVFAGDCCSYWASIPATVISRYYNILPVNVERMLSTTNIPKSFDPDASPMGSCTILQPTLQSQPVSFSTFLLTTGKCYNLVRNWRGLYCKSASTASILRDLIPMMLITISK